MEPRERMLGMVASPVGDDNEKVSVDFGDFVRKLVLFEQVVLDSLRLREFPLLIQKFGYDGIKELLDSGRMQIHWEAQTTGETGRTTELESREKKGALPLGSYSFSTIGVTERRLHIHNALQPINDVPGLTFKQAKTLRKLVGERIVAPPSGSGQMMMTQFLRDLESNAPTVKQSVAVAVGKGLKTSIDPSNFELRVEAIDGEGDFRTETNLGETLGLNEEQVHELVSRGLLGVAGLNQRIELMERYGAVTGFRVDEVPLFDAKLNFLTRQIDPDAHEERFERVVEVAGLPEVDPDPTVHDVDLPCLIEILDSDELREFRAWLRAVDSLQDAEVEHEISKLRDMLGRAVHSNAGKAVRFSAVTGIGLIPGAQLPALGLGVLDSFVVDRVVREPGPTAFLSHLYPTIFTKK